MSNATNTTGSLIDSADSDEQFWGHLEALLNAIGGEAALDTAERSASKRQALRAKARKHARWLAVRSGVRLNDPRAKELIKKVIG